MKLVTKNNYKFATGMFWQIPDEGKRSINLSKLVKDTRHNLMCQIKTINPTWGFCHKDELEGEKKVASLGKFIIEASGLSAGYANSIICYKFKNAGELDDNGRPLEKDLYGYIVLLNGTICPDEGEYVSSFEMVKESIIGQAKKYEIETLYLPLDVSASFFSIFENLMDGINNDELLTKVMHNLIDSQKQDLVNLINNELQGNSEKYTQLMHDSLMLNLDLLKSLINEQAFEQKLKEQKEKNLRYLIPNVLTLTLTSDEIYWTNVKFKSNYQNALIQPVSHRTTQKYKLLFLVFLLALFGYLVYKTFIYKDVQVQRPLPKPVVPRPVAVKPIQLINNCLTKNDKFFTDLGTWTLTKIKCNSLGATLTFDSDTDSTLSQFSKLINETDSNIKLTGRVGTYFIKYNIFSQSAIKNVSKEQILDQLQQAAINNSFKLSIPQPMSQMSNKNALIKFSILAKQSPVYLFNHGILDNVKLNEINASFDKSTGFYNWTLQGEF
jgi:hypothetical protein